MQHDAAGGRSRRFEGDREKIEHAALLGKIEADMAGGQDALEMQPGMAASVDIGRRLAAFAMEHHDEAHALMQIDDVRKREPGILEMGGDDREVLRVESRKRKRHESHHWLGAKAAAALSARKPRRNGARLSTRDLAAWASGTSPQEASCRPIAHAAKSFMRSRQDDATGATVQGTLGRHLRSKACFKGRGGEHLSLRKRRAVRRPASRICCRCARSSLSSCS